MTDEKSVEASAITRDQLAGLLNEDLSREYQAIIAYVVYSQVLKGPEYMNIADQLETHAHEELKHALVLSLKTRPYATTGNVSVSAKRSANTRSRSKSGRFSLTNRIIRSTWRRRSERKFLT